ncbi:hypothetical protein LCGC14_1647650 [marine sediment metagenome]|uniref:Uncharacterized protein n=1 Tax=marine sediment metagenome TaxID=412755 RepID=A0A0F9IKB4_9ZZZZ
MEIIIRPTRREAESQRQENLARRGLNPKRYRGTAGSLDEAHDKQRGLERDGERFDRFWEVFGPDAKKAEDELTLRAGINPETQEVLHG